MRDETKNKSKGYILSRTKKLKKGEVINFELFRKMFVWLD
jgi:hypothetical protein